MSRDLMRYDKMVEEALRGVVREALARTAQNGLIGGHHFYITFRTTAPGVIIPDYLVARYPEEMTIVLEHQFWGLEVEDDKFAVTLSFSNKAERLTIPLAAVTAFADPSVKFGLQFQEADRSEKPAEPGSAGPRRLKLADSENGPATPVELPASKGAPEEKKPPTGGGEVVTLDQFRKK